MTNTNPALSSSVSSLPVAVIGAGPIGLAAAARGMDFKAIGWERRQAKPCCSPAFFAPRPAAAPCGTINLVAEMHDADR